MKILLISPNPDRPEAHLFLGIVAAGHQVVWMGDKQASYYDLLVGAGIEFRKLALSSKFDWAAIRTIRGVLHEHAFDVVHSFTGRALSNALLAGFGLKICHVAYRGTMGHLSRLDPSSWLTFLNPSVKRIICVSDAVRQYVLTMGVSKERAVTIYKGHDLSWYEGAAHPITKWVDDPGAFVVGCTANMRKVKGVDLVVEALTQVPRDLKVHLLLIGELRDAAVQTAIDESLCGDRIHLLGFRRDAVELLASCQCVIMASREREGLPKAVIEGMAKGLPPIVTNVGGMPELVIDGECGLVVPPNDIPALAKAIEKLARSPQKAKALGQKARERIRTNFTIGQTIKEHLALYEECTGEAFRAAH